MTVYGCYVSNSLLEQCGVTGIKFQVLAFNRRLCHPAKCYKTTQNAIILFHNILRRMQRKML